MVDVEAVGDIWMKRIDNLTDIIKRLLIPNDTPSDTNFLFPRLALIFKIYVVNKISFPWRGLILRVVHGEKSNLMAGLFKQAGRFEVNFFCSPKTKVKFVDEKYLHIPHCIKTFENDILTP